MHQKWVPGPVVEWKTNIVAKVNSYGNFGLGVELGTW